LESNTDADSRALFRQQLKQVADYDLSLKADLNTAMSAFKLPYVNTTDPNNHLMYSPTDAEYETLYGVIKGLFTHDSVEVQKLASKPVYDLCNRAIGSNTVKDEMKIILKQLFGSSKLMSFDEVKVKTWINNDVAGILFVKQQLMDIVQSIAVLSRYYTETTGPGEGGVNASGVVNTANYAPNCRKVNFKSGAGIMVRWIIKDKNNGDNQEIKVNVRILQS